MSLRPILLIATGFTLAAAGRTRGNDADGAALYLKHCSMCHQATGQGVPGVFPPLAKSDFLAKERSRAIRAACEGLAGKIKVNGLDFNGAMPPVMVDDTSLAAIFSHVFSSWGNAERPVSVEEVSAERARTKFPTHEKLLAAHSFAPLPSAPSGWMLRESGQLQFSPVRMVLLPGDPCVLVLEQNGNVWRFFPGTGKSELALAGTAYIDLALGNPMVMGIGWDRSGRFYAVGNQRNEQKSPIMNEVTVWRTDPGKSALNLPAPRPWFRSSYPWGIGGFNHGLTHLAQGPDGKIYISSGSRTDGNETGQDARLSKQGETPLTACMWRLDPANDAPQLDIFCRGLRNPYGFCWKPDGAMWATDNGPDADAPEELNLLENGRHYGFPYRFSDWSQKPYPYTPDPPDGLTFAKPVRNLGPHGGFEDRSGPISTFSPHSSPAGLVWLESDAYPEAYRYCFLVTRYGNLLKKDKDTGFDLVKVKPIAAAEGDLRAEVETVLAPLARPIDILVWKPGRLLIAEYGRGTTFAAGLGQPGRILEFWVNER